MNERKGTYMLGGRAEHLGVFFDYKERSRSMKKIKKVMSEQKIIFQSFIFNVRKGEKSLFHHRGTSVKKDMSEK